MFLINYYIDSTDKSQEHTVKVASDLAWWIETMFQAYGSRLVVTSIISV